MRQEYAGRRARSRRGFLRTLERVVLFPTRLPKLRLEVVDGIKRVCECSGIVLVIALMANMVNASGFSTGLCVCAAAVFFVSLLLIRLRIYQDDLTEHGYMS